MYKTMPGTSGLLRAQDLHKASAHHIDGGQDILHHQLAVGGLTRLLLLQGPLASAQLVGPRLTAHKQLSPAARLDSSADQGI